MSILDYSGLDLGASSKLIKSCVTPSLSLTLMAINIYSELQPTRATVGYFITAPRITIIYTGLWPSTDLPALSCQLRSLAGQGRNKTKSPVI